MILNWNGAKDSINCANSLITQSNKSPFLIIIDNDSSDNSAQLLKDFCDKHPQQTHLIINSVNSGFAGGNNVGFTYALEKGFKYIGTLNPDATANASWVDSLVRVLDDNLEVGVSTGIIAKSDKKYIDTTGEQFSTWGIPSPRGRNQPLDKAPRQEEYIFGSSGGGFIARADVLRDIGMFDEKFFMYFEDVDFCFRAQLAGYRVRYTPKAIVYHKLSASANKVPGLAVYNTFKNLPMLYVKNMPLGLWLHTYPRFILAYTLILGNAIVRGRGGPAIKGWLRSWTLIPHMFSERFRIQKSRKVSTEYISSIILHDIPQEQTGLRQFRKTFTGK